MIEQKLTERRLRNAKLKAAYARWRKRCDQLEEIQHEDRTDHAAADAGRHQKACRISP